MGSEMTSLEARQREHILYTWTAQSQASPVSIAGGEGVWFDDQDGNRWLNLESQVFNCNAGHGQTAISDAIREQAADLACAHPAAVFEAKATLGESLARITPGDLNRFFLCLSGSEANENAYKMARLLTGRQKVIARRRSYHGSSMGALSLTGDPRRWPLEPGLGGVLRTEDPYWYRCPLRSTPEACSKRCTDHLEHVIEMEGAENIAAVFLEGVTGSNGGFIPPAEYWPKVREICDRHGILLISDEVFSGFGRTGTWFAVDHWGVVPDMITMAKGVTGGYAPLGVVALRESLAKRFDEETLWCGLTGYAHPLSCAAATAAIKVYEDQGLMENAQQMGLRLTKRLEELKTRHEIIGDVRNLGVFGTIEFVKDRETREPLTPYGTNGPADSFLGRLRAALRARRVHIAQKWTHLFIAPTCINESEIDLAVSLIEESIVEALAGGKI